MSQNKLMQITVTFNSAKFQKQDIPCKLNDKLETVIIKYASKINKDPKSLVFLYNAKKIEKKDFKKDLNEIITKRDKEQKKMTISVLEKENFIINNTTVIDISNNNKESNNNINNNNITNNTNINETDINLTAIASNNNRNILSGINQIPSNINNRTTVQETSTIGTILNSTSHEEENSKC